MGRRFRCLIATCVALETTALTFCAQRLAAQQDSTAILIRGVLIDEQTRASVGTAALRLIRPDGNTEASTFADSLGRYRLAVSSAGTYRIVAERIGYYSQPSRILELSARDTVTVDFRLAPNAVTLDSVLVRARAAPRLTAGEQLIHGRLLDDATREPIAQGTIELLLENGRRIKSTVSDEYGLFRIVSPRPATYNLRAERIGYRTAEQKGLHLMLGDTLRLDFFLSTQAVLLAPITVTASARDVTNRYRQVGMQDFNRRMAQFSRAGWGTFLLRDTLADYEKRGYDTKFMLTQRALMTPVRCGQRPIIHVYVNGAPYPISEADVYFQYSLADLEAIEIYVYPVIPADFPIRGRVCKVIALWTRRSG